METINENMHFNSIRYLNVPNHVEYVYIYLEYVFYFDSLSVPEQQQHILLIIDYTISR